MEINHGNCNNQSLCLCSRARLTSVCNSVSTVQSTTATTNTSPDQQQIWWIEFINTRPLPIFALMYSQFGLQRLKLSVSTSRPPIFGSNWWQTLPSLNRKYGSYDVIADLEWIWNISSDKTLQKDKMRLSWTNNFNFQFWRFWRFIQPPNMWYAPLFAMSTNVTYIIYQSL